MLHSTQSKENGWSLPRGNYSVEQMDLDCSAPFQLLWKRSEITDKCKLMMLQNSTDFNSVYSSLRSFFTFDKCMFFSCVWINITFFPMTFLPTHTKKVEILLKWHLYKLLQPRFQLCQLLSFESWALLLCQLFFLKCDMLNLSSCNTNCFEAEQKKIACLVRQSKCQF